MLEQQSNDSQIRPLRDVWLRPRRVFRELALKPIGPVDYLLGAAQGIVGVLALSQMVNAGAKLQVGEILAMALTSGTIAGVVSLFFMTAIYTRLSARTGGAANRQQVFHVLSYGSVPLAASLGIWLITALVAGQNTFMKTAQTNTDGFVMLLLQAQFIAHIFLTCWSLLLQIMGFSEIQGFATRRAFGFWALGQLIALVVSVVLITVITNIFNPGANPGI